MQFKQHEVKKFHMPHTLDNCQVTYPFTDHSHFLDNLVADTSRVLFFSRTFLPKPLYRNLTMTPDYANIWRPSDGDGASDKTNWKICDHLPPGQLSNTNRPPMNTYLTDRVFQVVSESAISGRKKGTWWSGDFDSNGKPRVSRANRGAAVLDPATSQAAIVTLSDGKQISLVGDPEWSAPSSPILPKSRPASGETMKNTNPCKRPQLASAPCCL